MYGAGMLEITKDSNAQCFHHSVFFTCDRQLRHTLTLVSCQVLVDIYLDHMHILFLAHIATERVCVHISVSILHLFHIFFRLLILYFFCF